uniref:Uncharacterized protein n=1 Tax=Leersia perrieri TaxID=77586 RepID=A0A0D9XM19_9ORYZ
MSSSSSSSHCDDLPATFRHRPWDRLDETALLIINQTYAAAAAIASPGRRFLHDGAVEVSSIADSSPAVVVTVIATPASCFVTLDAAAAPHNYAKLTSSKKKARLGHCLARTSVSVLPATLYLSLNSGDGGNGGDMMECCSSGEVAAAGGAVAIVEAIRMRLEEAIRHETAILVDGRRFKCVAGGTSSGLEEVIEVMKALEEMRREIDVPVMVRMRRLKRCHGDVGGGDITMADQEEDVDDEAMVKRFRAMGFL